MKVRLSPFALVFGLIVYALVSWVKWQVITASLVSVVCFCIAAFTRPEASAGYFRHDLIEFWLAVLAWLAGGALLVTQTVRSTLRRRGSRIDRTPRQSAAWWVLAAMGFVALTAPIIAPLPPNNQGRLSTTRLLPPLSRGTIVEAAGAGTVEYTGSVVTDRLFQANMILLTPVTFSGADASGDPAPPAYQNVRPVFFLFGTDDVGRDVFSRALYGSRVTLLVGLAAAIGSLAIGILVGFGAGYGNVLADVLLMRLTDFALSVPSIFLVVASMAFAGKSLPTLVTVLALTGWMGIARAVRAEVLRLRRTEFVLSAILMNQSAGKVLKNHILPNLKSLLVVAVVMQFANAVLAEASLSFIGLGIQPPTASWGNMLWQSLASLQSGWWLGFFPGGLLAIVVAAHYAAERNGGRTA